MSSTGQLKFEENVFFFSRVFPQWYKKPWLWTIIYHWGNTLTKKKQFFLNLSFPIEDAEKWIKHHFFVYRKSISDQNIKGIPQKIGLPHPWEVQNWNGLGGRSFWATTFNFFWKFIFFEDLQMIEKPFSAKSNGVEFGCTWCKLGIQV